MEIKAGCTYDYKTCKAISHIVSYKKQHPKKAVALHIFIAIFLALLNLWVIETTGGVTGNIVMMYFCLLIAVADIVLYFLMPRLQYSSMSKMKDLSNTYIFRDTDFVAATDSSNYSGDSVIEYSFLEKIMETKDYFFIFINKRQIYAVDKSTFIDGDAASLSRIFSSALGKKYILCKY